MKTQHRAAERTDAPGEAPDAAAQLHVIFTENFDVVWHHLRRMGVTEADRDDLVQEVFCVVHRRLDRYDRSRPLRPWLLGIATHLVLHHWRAASRRPVDTGVSEAKIERAMASSADPQEQDDRHTLAALLATIEPEQRAVFVLHELEGFSVPEIAQLIEAPPNTVYSRLRRTRLQLVELAQRWQKGAP